MGGRREGGREGRERGRKRRGGGGRWKWSKAINPQIHTSPRHTSSIKASPLKSSIISPTNATNWGPTTQLPDISHSNHHTLNSHFSVILITFSNNRTFVWIKSLYLSSHLSHFEKIDLYMHLLVFNLSCFSFISQNFQVTLKFYTCVYICVCVNVWTHVQAWGCVQRPERNISSLHGSLSILHFFEISH